MADEAEKNSLFRQEALDKISSPEQLDQLLQVISLKDWWPLASLGFLVAIALLWSILGRIPLTAQAKGLLLQNTSNPKQLISISYFPIEDGRQIQPGDRMLVTPVTANYQEVGGLEATVTEVSTQPVMRSVALQHVQNNAELLDLVYVPASIEVIAQLKPDASTPTGYQWSMSKGPEMQLAGGVPTQGRVTLSERSPIQFIFPFLK
ncbi:MAG: hypothetical protein MUF49_12355 [Oculatellaceae cyanobacterium Prado106]|jgi:hypothetical protein|nr:hypothetical protein [Oculatellaceae cyanobacterium Prado106]